MPSNVIDSKILEVEEEVKSKPVASPEPPAKEKAAAPPSQDDALSKMVPMKKKGLEPLTSPDSKPPAHLAPLNAEKEKKQIAEVDKELKKIEEKKETSLDYADDFDEEIPEDLPEEDQFEESADKEGHGASNSQSMGMDPSVTSLDIEGYDHIEEVQLI